MKSCLQLFLLFLFIAGCQTSGRQDLQKPASHANDVVEFGKTEMLRLSKRFKTHLNAHASSSVAFDAFREEDIELMDLSVLPLEYVVVYGKIRTDGPFSPIASVKTGTADRKHLPSLPELHRLVKKRFRSGFAKSGSFVFLANPKHKAESESEETMFVVGATFRWSAQNTAGNEFIVLGLLPYLVE